MSRNGLFCKGSGGLALVEVLVALSLVAVALPALLLAVDTVTDNTRHLRDQTMARWIASDQLNEARINRIGGQALQGERSGNVEMAQQRWSWKMISRAAEVPGMRQLEVSVSKEGGEPLVTLRTALEE